MTDNEIIQRILEGKKDLYDVLVERYQLMIFRTCIGFVHNKEDADDLTQEVFIQAYQSIKRFRNESSFSTWLYRIAVNASLNRKRKKFGNNLLRYFEISSDRNKDPERVIEIADTEDPETIVLRKEHHDWLEQALDQLPEKQKTAIVLSKYDELSQKEIAAIMNITEGAVESLLQRAKANLRQKLRASKQKK